VSRRYIAGLDETRFFTLVSSINKQHIIDGDVSELRKFSASDKVSHSREQYVTLSIPKPLYEKARGAIEGTGFRSVTEYVIFVLRESLLLKPGESVKERLRALGYVD